MNTDIDPELALWGKNPLPLDARLSSFSKADAALEFGHCRVLLRQRRLLADGVPVELGTRAFDLLLVLLEADGLLVPKEELLSRVWPGIVVSEENLKVQVSALRKALGADREAIHTEFGRGYRFTGVLCVNTLTDPPQRLTRAKLRFAHTPPPPATGEGIEWGPQNWRQSLRCSFSLS